VTDLQLKGRYITFEDGALVLQNTQAGSPFSWRAPNHPVLSPVLSPNGVAGWIVTGTPWPSSESLPQTVLVVLTPNGGSGGNGALDYGPESSTTLANLQLYNCAAGCPSNAVIVAWTDNGLQRYAQVSGASP
jgi:hypothetical protein